MFRRLLLQHLYRVRGKIFGPPHKVGLASHIRNGNFGEVCIEKPHGFNINIAGGVDRHLKLPAGVPPGQISIHTRDVNPLR
jgi:hypothetical protein